VSLSERKTLATRAERLYFLLLLEGEARKCGEMFVKRRRKEENGGI